VATLSEVEIARLLAPYFPAPPAELLTQLSTYLDLLVKWNQRTNLSAIREPREMVSRHFGESLFAARQLPFGKTLLDLGSGAGFPGLPIALVRPEMVVTLAESQNKKASFLREVVRTLGVSVEVWAGRAEDLPGERRFDGITLRAVDRSEAALAVARGRLAVGGAIFHFTSGACAGEDVRMPGSDLMRIAVYR
jgi:16S rRNA (guanine527-N7)-methyltransferase